MADRRRNVEDWSTEEIMTVLDEQLSDIEGLDDEEETDITQMDVFLDNLRNPDEHEDELHEDIHDSDHNDDDGGLADNIEEPGPSTRNVGERKASGNKKAPKKKKLQPKWNNRVTPPLVKSFTTDLSLYLDVDEENTLSPISYFEKYITPDLIDTMVMYTNMHALQNQVQRFSPTDTNEIRAFIGLHIMMGCLKYPRVRLYWDSLLGIPLFSSTMSVNRFFQLRTNLHFVDNLAIPRENKDRFYKVRPLYDQLRMRCLALELEESVSVDEQMIPFKGNINVKQYVKNKPIRWGIKNYMLCGQSGLCYDFVLYQGSSTEFNENVIAEFGVSAGVVHHLSQRLTRPGHKLFFDNYFTSYEILRYLKDRHIYAAGTMRQNRFPGAATAINDSALKTKARGHCEARQSEHGIIITKWLDNKIVSLASNYVGKGDISTVRRWCGQQKSYIQVERPEVIKEYNAGMGGVDKCDFLISLYRTFIRTKKWPLRMFNHAVDLMLTNSWLEYMRDCEKMRIPKKERLDLLHFRLYVTQALIKKDVNPTRKRGRPSSSESTPRSSRSPTPSSTGSSPREVRPIPDVRFDGVWHLPAFDGKSFASRCKNRGCTARTHWQCEKCAIHLCLTQKNNCFRDYHLPNK